MVLIQDISVNFGQRSRFVVFVHNIMMFFMGKDIVKHPDKKVLLIGEIKVAITLAYLFRNNIFTVTHYRHISTRCFDMVNIRKFLKWGRYLEEKSFINYC